MKGVNDMDTYKFHGMTLHFLDGNRGRMDGGRYFGPLPRAVWGSRVPYDNENMIAEQDDPILIQYKGRNLLIDAGYANSKMSEKMLRNEGVLSENMTVASLATLGLTPEDIDTVLLTHMHYDHASGLTYKEGEEILSQFPHAKIYVSETELYEAMHPNARTRGTYAEDNWQPILSQFETFTDHIEIMEGIDMYLMGGHSKGISNVVLTQEGQRMIHLSDNMPMNFHNKSVYVTGLDDYPMDTIAAKQHWFEEGIKRGDAFFFYHDAYYTFVKWDSTGKQIIDCQRRSTPAYLPMEDK